MRVALDFRDDDYEVGFKYCVGWPKKYLTSDYFIKQEYDTGMFGLFGEPFDVVFKDRQKDLSGVNENYYFHLQHGSKTCCLTRFQRSSALRLNMWFCKFDYFSLEFPRSF